MRLVALIFAMVLAFSASANASPSLPDPLRLGQTIWGDAGVLYEVDPYLLYAIALVESGRVWADGLVYPSPYAVYAPGSAKAFRTKAAAEKLLRQYLDRGDEGVNLGMMQVNLYWHKDKVKRPEDLLDIEMNVLVGARILSQAISSSRDPALGIGRYSTWKSQAAREYGARILQVAENLRNLPSRTPGRP
jgi:hypothetical protein